MPEKNAKLRVDENGVPIIVVARQIQILCHEMQHEDDYGNISDFKLRPSQSFLSAFNDRVLDLLEACSNSAINEKRTTLMDKDVPDLRPFLGLEELEGDQNETQPETDENGEPAWNLRKI